MPKPSPSLRWLAAAALILLLADWAYRAVGDSVVPGGPLDELAHLMTTLIVLWALGRRACDRFLIPALVASVAIDADHVPGALGDDFSHTGYLGAMAVFAAVAMLSPRFPARRSACLES